MVDSSRLSSIMQKFNFAASRLVNPPGATPVLSEEQVWKGLQIKARNPVPFIPTAQSSQVFDDEGNKFTRKVLFKGFDAPITEEVQLYGDTIVYFDSPDLGTRITNTLSYDENDQLVLTFAFTGGVPGFKPEGNENPDPKSLNQAVGKGVAFTVQKIRDLVTEGAI